MVATKLFDIGRLWRIVSVSPNFIVRSRIMPFPVAYVYIGDRRISIRREWSDDGTDWKLWGEAGALATSYWSGSCPIGILLDRLQEEPSECEAPAEELKDVVLWLRQQYPADHLFGISPPTSVGE